MKKKTKIKQKIKALLSSAKFLQLVWALLLSLKNEIIYHYANCGFPFSYTLAQKQNKRPTDQKNCYDYAFSGKGALEGVSIPCSCFCL